MWCRVCAQDVPGIPSLDEGQYTCARCGDAVTSISHGPAAQPEAPSPPSDEAAHAGRRTPNYDGWEMDEQLGHVRRVLGSVRRFTERNESPTAEPRFRVDAGHGPRTPHHKRPRKASRRPHRAAEEPHGGPAPGDRTLAVMAWSALSIGTTGFACGLALIIWSMSTGVQELWSIGAPIILAGQIALVLGLVLQLDRIWRDHRRAAARLETVDEQLSDLKTTTTLLGTSHGPSSAFYAHWAGGANPEILLNDLKSQLDLLAVKLADR